MDTFRLPVSKRYNRTPKKQTNPTLMRKSFWTREKKSRGLRVELCLLATPRIPTGTTPRFLGTTPVASAAPSTQLRRPPVGTQIVHSVEPPILGTPPVPRNRHKNLLVDGTNERSRTLCTLGVHDTPLVLAPLHSLSSPHGPERITPSSDTSLRSRI